MYLPLLEDRRVAVFSNHSGIVGDRAEGLKYPAGAYACMDGRRGRRLQIDDASMTAPFGTPADSTVAVTYGPHIVDVLLSQGVDVTAIFSPEHGFRGTADAGEKVGGSVDAQTGIPILSLYSAAGPVPSDESMETFDVLVVDIQDVGMRFYTYYITMYHLMEACAAHGKRVVVLDRPNPNGYYVDGPLLDMRYKSGIGIFPIPISHGMTMGELALMMVGEGWLGSKELDLHVVPCLNYTHGTLYRLLRAPSPNLKDMKSVYLFASCCFFEGTVLSEGRGTQWSFEVYGHPRLNPDPERLGGVFRFTPRSIPGAAKPKLENEECLGRNLRQVPTADILAAGVNPEYIIDAYSAFEGEVFFLGGDAFEKRSGQAWVREMIEGGSGAAEISRVWKKDVEEFEALRRPYLLYPD